MKADEHPMQWYERNCPKAHPPGHCKLCLVFYADIDGEQWKFPDENATMSLARAAQIVAERRRDGE